jgi:hypothetical protein
MASGGWSCSGRGKAGRLYLFSVIPDILLVVVVVLLLGRFREVRAKVLSFSSPILANSPITKR